MALEFALQWLRGPMKHVQGVLSIVSGYIFQFEGVQVRQLRRRSDCSIHCLVELSDGWAVGDGFGDVSIYDTDAVQCLYVVRHAYPVYTIAALPHNHFVSNADQGFWVVQLPTSRHITFQNDQHSDYKHCILKLVAFPNGIVASITKCGPWVHVWDMHTGCCIHTLNGSGVAADIVTCGDRLLSVHKKVESTAWVWDAQSGAHLQTIALNCLYFKTCTALDEQTMCFHVVGGLFVFNVQTWSLRFERTLDMCSWTTFDDQIMCSSLCNDTLTMLDTNTGAVRVLSCPKIKALQASQVDRMLYIRSGHIVASSKGKLFVWR